MQGSVKIQGKAFWVCVALLVVVGEVVTHRVMVGAGVARDLGVPVAPSSSFFCIFAAFWVGFRGGVNQRGRASVGVTPGPWVPVASSTSARRLCLCCLSM